MNYDSINEPSESTMMSCSVCYQPITQHYTTLESTSDEVVGSNLSLRISSSGGSSVLLLDSGGDTSS